MAMVTETMLMQESSPKAMVLLKKHNSLTEAKENKQTQIIFSFCFIISLISGWHNLLMPFLAPVLAHTCIAPATETLTVGNQTRLELESWTNVGTGGVYRIEEKDQLKSQCLFEYHNTSSDEDGEFIPCTKWNYDMATYGYTLVSKWDLVCDREWLISAGQSVFMGGIVSAMIICGHLSDRLGRRPTCFIALFIFTIAGFLCLLSPSYLIFTVFRFFLSMGITGAGTTSFILLMEMADVKSRSRYGIGFQFGWSTGYVILPGLAWLIKDWFYLQLVTMLPGLALTAFWWYVPESTRWIESKRNGNKNISEDNDLIAGYSVITEVITDASRTSDKSHTGTKINNYKASLVDLVKTPNMRKKSLVLFFCWFVNSFIYFGLSLNTGNLGGDPYLNFFIAGAIEFPAYIGATHLLRVVGRRIPQMSALVIGGMACLLTIPFMEGPVWARIALAMTGKFCITASFAILYVLSAEIYPTVVRTLGVGSCSVFARLGSMVAPFVKELGEATHPTVPFAVFGSMSVVSGLTIFWLPETHMSSLPDTVQDGEAI